MIPFIVTTAAIGGAFVLLEVVDLGLSSPWTFLVVVAFANVALLFGARAGARSGPLPAGRQRRMRSLVARSLPHMRLGLNEETADRTARLLQEAMHLDAVSITDRERILAFVGTASDHHGAGVLSSENVALRAMWSGELTVVSERSQLGCRALSNGCPLRSAVVAPLVCNDYTVGSLSVYGVGDGPPEAGLVDLVRGLAQVLSLQLELAQAHRESQMTDIAKLDALRAQINPHFLFNTLNTIAMKARTDPEEARRLLVRLSDFLRYAMRSMGHTAPFAEEYFFVRTYLFLEKARFEERLQVRYEVDPQVLSIPVPVLTIQPLVENAIKHGIASKPGGGRVELKGQLDRIGSTLRIRVRDDGLGMESDVIPKLLEPGRQSSALANIHERLVRLYGGRASLDIRSAPGRGTTVSVNLPVG